MKTMIKPMNRRGFLVGGMAAALPFAAGCRAAGKHAPGGERTAVEERAAGRDPTAAQVEARPPLEEVLSLRGESFWRGLRGQFPLDRDLTYMNNGGLGPSPYSVIERVTGSIMELETVSETGHGLLAGIREKAAAFFHCREKELAFTRSTTEGMNIIARGLPLKGGDEVLLSTHEHPGGAMPWLGLAKDIGIRVKLFEPGGGGEDTLDRIASALTPRTRALSISHVTCTTGLRVPAGRISALCRERGIFSVFDGAQSAGMFPVDLQGMGCDFYATSGHKWLLGPHGTGLVYVRGDVLETWQPTYVGAYSDKKYDLDALHLDYLPEARSTEYGTRNDSLVLGLGAALDFLNAVGMERVAARGQALAGRVKAGLREMDALEVLTPMNNDASGSMVTFRPRDRSRIPWDWVNTLRKEHRIRLRPVGEHGLNGVRVSTHVYNSLEEVDRLLAALKEVMRD